MVIRREFGFSAEHFRLISERVYRFSGIRLPEGKREMVYARLAREWQSIPGHTDDVVDQLAEILRTVVVPQARLLKVTTRWHDRGKRDENRGREAIKISHKTSFSERLPDPLLRVHVLSNNKTLESPKGNRLITEK